MIRFECAQCGKHLRAEDHHAGRKALCPRCGMKMRVPTPAQPEPLAEAPPSAAPEPVLAGVGAKVAAVRAARRHVDRGKEQPLVAKARKIEYEDLIDMTAMVDIVFFLLIFFLVTSMQGLGSSIPMPTPEADEAAAGTTAAQPAAEESNAIVVNIDDQDRIWIDGEEMANESELIAKLYELRESAGNPDELLIVGSGDASHGAAVLVHDSGNEAGISLVRLAIREEAE